MKNEWTELQKMKLFSIENIKEISLRRFNKILNDEEIEEAYNKYVNYMTDFFIFGKDIKIDNILEGNIK